VASQADGTDPQRRDQQLQELTAGTQELHNAPITLTEYDADWPRSGAPEVERMLRFRDRLRDDDVAREHYVRTKRALAQRVWRHVQDYADAKTAVIQEILGEAEGRTHREQLTNEVGE